MKQKTQRSIDPRKLLVVNEDIKARKVLLLNEEGEKIGVYGFVEAYEMAKADFQDLIQIGFNEAEQMAIVKMMEIGKYLYTMKKDDKDKKKTQKVKGMKEIVFGYRISDHDLDIKLQKLQEIMDDGYNVKLIVKLKRREFKFKEKVGEKFKELETKLSDIAKSQGVKEEGFGYSMILSPKSTKGK